MINKTYFSKINWKRLFIVLTVMTCVLMCYVSLDFSVTEDSKLHREHGKRLLEYFKDESNIAALSPLDENDKLINIALNTESQHRGMNGFGGFFDLLAEFVSQYLSFLDIYEVRNLLNAVFGFFLFLYSALIARELSGWKAAILVFVSIVLMPMIFGHVMFNFKDIPFATFYIIIGYHLIKLYKELPILTIKRSCYLVVFIGLLINIRLLGIVMIGQLFFVVFIWWIDHFFIQKTEKATLKSSSLLGGKIIAIAIFGYLSASLFWPYAKSNPLLAPIKMFLAIKDFKGFISTQLFEGVWRSSYEMPWYYHLKSLLIIKSPLFFFIGLFFIPVLFYKSERKIKMSYLLLLFISLFPILLVIVGKPNSYDNGRHFLFIVAPLVIVIALAWGKIISLLKNIYIRLGVLTFLGILMLQPLAFMIRNHPLQSTYFSPIIGGVENAYGKYEIDYWGISIKKAFDWLEKNTTYKSDGTPIKVRLYYGEKHKASYYTNKIPHLEFVNSHKNSAAWDYSITLLTEAKFDKNLKDNWPPKNAVYQVETDGVPICYVVKNDFKRNPQTSVGFTNLSLELYQKGDYINTIKIARKAILLNNLNDVAYNNMCAAYNHLKMFEAAREAGEKCISINSENQLGKNNLKAALLGIQSLETKKRTVSDYLTLGYNYYQLNEYQKCIEVNYSVIELEPNNYIAYNNICSAYNELKIYEEAIKACEKALSINGDHTLSRNNLNWAKQNK